MRTNKLNRAVKEAVSLLDSGVYDPLDLFELIYRGSNYDYRTVRRAVHIAKSSIYKEG